MTVQVIPAFSEALSEAEGPAWHHGLDFDVELTFLRTAGVLAG